MRIAALQGRRTNDRCVPPMYANLGAQSIGQEKILIQEMLIVKLNRIGSAGRIE
jgi:hypothetical protein